jgi:hypothetical protein
MKIDVQVIAENAAKPVTLMFPGPRGMCSCGWIGKARWTVLYTVRGLMPNSTAMI